MVPLSNTTMSASGVVSMALANIGPVLLCKIFSEMLAPCGDDLVEMLKDDLAHLTSQCSCIQNPQR